MAEGLGSGPDPMGAYYYCGGLHNINEAYTYLDYQFEEPDFPVPVQRSDDIFESSDGYYGYWLQGMYAVYSDGGSTATELLLRTLFMKNAVLNRMVFWQRKRTENGGI